ncbi:MAG TPA: fumarylacetoacetase [Candidatus Limnocylindria bacterium]|nr:fumarylacetoacetase [Candidatus Limnocylindria bacterium]
MSTPTWVPVPDGSPFPVQNLPYGVFSPAGGPPRCGVAIGEHVLDLSQVRVPHADSFAAASLNGFLARGRTAWSEVRATVTDLLTDERHRAAVEPHLHRIDAVTMHLPVEVADYVDFYSSEHHAMNVGAIFRPDSPALPPNWKHLPIGYHGRAGTLVVTGTDVVRPSGQRKPPDAAEPVFGPSRRLDIEAEVAFVVGVPSVLGDVVPASSFRDHVFGLALLNDWSARDIQAWEYQPLGPFLGKSFATSLSAWIVPLEALEAARIPLPRQEPSVLPYLTDDDPWTLDLALEVLLNGEAVSRPPFSTMYWSPGQQLAHLTVNGASLRTGDVFASGTVSGPEVGQRGSFLELSWGGREPLELPSGRAVTFLEDGDEVTITGWADGADGVRIGLGSVTGRIRPAR